MRMAANVTFQPLYPQEKDKAPTVQLAEKAAELIWRNTENPTATGTRCPDRPACSN